MGTHQEQPTRSQKPNEEETILSEGRVDKQYQWEQKLKQLETLGDGLGKGLDNGIKEAVAVIQLFGILTRQSCQGHLNWGDAAPWIDIDLPLDIYALGQRRRELVDQLDSLEEGTAEFEEVSQEERLMWHEERRLEALELKKTFVLLEEFYRERHVPYDERLIMDGRGRLTNQGSMLQPGEDEARRGKNLYRYQREMKAFTEFLKQKFFSQ